MSHDLALVHAYVTSLRIGLRSCGHVVVVVVVKLSYFMVR
jgi:hypothetical protein